MNYITDFIVYDNSTPYYGDNLEELLPEGVYDNAIRTGVIEPCYRIYRWINNNYELFDIV